MYTICIYVLNNSLKWQYSSLLSSSIHLAVCPYESTWPISSFSSHLMTDNEYRLKQQKSRHQTQAQLTAQQNTAYFRNCFPGTHA